MAITIRMVPVAECNGDDQGAMFSLLRSYFDGVCWEDFRHDLTEKDRVMLLTESESNTIVGFSTLMRLTVATCDGPITIVFSGDTVVDESSRSYCGFGYALAEYFELARREAGTRPAYYVLISKGWRTYRIMPFMFQRFYPTHTAVTPESVRRIITAFGRTKYPELYDERRGLILGRPLGPRIRHDGPDVVSAHRLADPHVSFFTVANPHHNLGDELVCIADLNIANYTPTFTRMIRRYRGEQS